MLVIHHRGQLHELADTVRSPVSTVENQHQLTGPAILGKLVDITTRCLCNGDHVCGNEYLYYPPLTKIRNATAAFTQMFAYQGGDLGIKWISIGHRGAFVGTFGR